MVTWFESVVGPEYAPAAMWTVIAIVALIVLLIVLRLLRGLSSGTFVMGGRNRKARLAVMDATAVDANRRLVLVRRDEVEHLILIGGPTDVVVEQNIRPYTASARQHAEPEGFAPSVPQPAPAPRPVRTIEDAPVVAPPISAPRPPERPAPAPQRQATPVQAPRPPVPQAPYAEPSLQTSAAQPAAQSAPQPPYAPAPVIERPVAPVVPPPVQRDFPSAPSQSRAEPSLDITPPRQAAPVRAQTRDDDDSALEDEMNRLLSDFAPEPKR